MGIPQPGLNDWHQPSEFRLAADPNRPKPQVLSRDAQSPNPASEWITEVAWDNVSELDKLSAFRDIVASFEQNSLEWKKWCGPPLSLSRARVLVSLAPSR